MAEFEELYEQAPGGEEEAAIIEPPQGYKPLGAKQRTDWNNFLRFLNKEKKIGGSKELDDRSAEKGFQLMEEYRKNNPDFSITREQVPFIQYELQQLNNTGTLPGFQPEGNVKKMLGAYMGHREVSPVDGWIGSITSRTGYPEIKSVDREYEPDTDTKSKRYWGTDYEGANEFERSPRR